jgi:hypothetical protein
MIVRERPHSFVLVRQHDHALASGRFAEHWAQQPYPYRSTLYAVANHDIAWRDLDREVRWSEETGRPYSFTDYPPEPKVRAYAAGIDLVQTRDPYAACLCSMHYETLVRDFGRSEAERRFVEAEARRQAGLKVGMADEESRNLGRNLRFLRLCDGLSLFVCLNEPGEEGQPPPYPEGFEFDGVRFEPMWEDGSTLGLEPTPFSGPFELEIPYEELGKDGRPLGGGALRFRVVR